jgi:hypothetical protein
VGVITRTELASKRDYNPQSKLNLKLKDLLTHKSFNTGTLISVWHPEHGYMGFEASLKVNESLSQDSFDNWRCAE